MPWLGAGYSRDGGLPSMEMLGSQFHDRLLASFVAGAQRTATNGPAWFDGQDVDEIGSVMAGLTGDVPSEQRERIITDGLPIPTSQLRTWRLDPGPLDRVFGMEYDDQVLIAVTLMGLADPEYDVHVELRKHLCDVYEVEREGVLGAFVGTLGPVAETFTITYTDEDAYRTRLFYGECSPF